jgi:hypothetical protein
MKALYKILLLLMVAILMIGCCQDDTNKNRGTIKVDVALDTSLSLGGYTALVSVQEPCLGGIFLGLVFDVLITNCGNSSDTITDWQFIEHPIESASYRVDYLENINRFCTENKLTMKPPLILFPHESVKFKMVHCVEVDEHISGYINMQYNDPGHLIWKELMNDYRMYKNKPVLDSCIHDNNCKCYIPFAVLLYTNDSIYYKNVEL